MVVRNSLSRTAILVVGLLGAASLHVVDLDGLTGGQAAYAVPEGGSLEPIIEVGKCPKLGICGKVVGTDGGCRGRPCCNGDDMYCFKALAPGPGQFDRVKLAKEGTCYAPDPKKKLIWCTITDCGDKACGAAGGCDLAGESDLIRKAPMKAAGPCGGDES